ncbi:MAG TPA: YnfA family protein [Nitrospiraceae bacterium]|nr:YnfA family protein [Nitrospiraceae bacterium]
MHIAQSVTLFLIAGLFEIGGGYLVWQWWRDQRHWSIGLLGAAMLFLYGIVPTYQPAHFGRAYAAYGGWFIVLSIIWGWQVDRITPDRFDLIGGLLCLSGVTLIMYWPR